MQETKIINCKICDIPHEAFLSGTYNGLNKKWLDKNGKMFCGKYCPDCNVKRVRENMAKLRAKRKETNAASTGSNQGTVN